MNELNFASLRASKKLVDNGIVLETEYYWCLDNSVGWYLRDESTFAFDVHASIPAPCFTEVWRELPEGAECKKQAEETKCVVVTQDNIKVMFSPNPTDALIDLLVWLKGQFEN